MSDEGAHAADRDEPDRGARLLAEFLHERDYLCPCCGYNLRNLTSPICPECEEPLGLAVKAEQLHVGAFIATIAPGIFCGLLVVLIVIVAMIGGGGGGGGGMPAPACIFMLFLIASGITSLVLVGNSRAFLKQKREKQVGWAVMSWVIHLAVFIVFFTWMASSI